MIDQLQPQLALAELDRRRAILGQAVADRQLRRPAAEALAGLWCGIAAWHGATLPEDLRPYAGFQLWTDHAPAGMPAADWLLALAHEARRAFTQAERSEPAGDRTRALRLIAQPLATAARIPLVEPAAEERKAA